MEIRQLEYFLCVAELGSINRAAEALFTAQPNVSKVINALEKELQVDLFIRTSKGVKLTLKGEEIYDYAKRALQNVKIINEIVSHQVSQKLNIACYPSHMIARTLCDYYKHHNVVKIDFIEDTVESIVEHVKSNRAEIGIVYVSEDQRCCFNHTLGHKNMHFELLAQRPSCIYVGPQHPLYHEESIDFEMLPSLKFVQASKDFFATPHHLEQISQNDKQRLNHVITTNSDHVMIDLLLTTDLCSFGIHLMNSAYEQYEIKALTIKNYEHNFLLGYIMRNGETLSEEAKQFIALLKETVKNS